MTDPPKPNFLIVGAAKAGTSSLWDWLSRHPDVFMSRNKEPGFFLHGWGLDDWHEYLSLFGDARGQHRIGEASAAYLAAPESPRWIRDTLGDIPIVIVLRNPIQRAYSLYCWMLMEGYEAIGDFAAALAAEELRRTSEPFARECPQYFADYWYFQTGLYHAQVQRYLEAFGAGSVKVFLFDDLVSRPAEFYAELCSFLGLARVDRLDPPEKNVSVTPKSIKWQCRLRRWQRASRRRWGAGSKPLRVLCDLAMKLNLAAGTKRPIPAAIKKQLADAYREDVGRLSSLLGRDLSHWLKT